MKENQKIIAIIPAFNEEGKIKRVVSKIQESARFVDLILVVDDGSDDKTVKQAMEEGVKVLKHEKNRGVGAAIRTGIDYAVNNDYDIVVILGGDDQDDPAQIKRLVDPIIFDGYGFVQGSRYLKGGKTINITRFRLTTTLFYSYLFRLVKGFHITDGTNGFRAFRTSIFKNNKKINIWQDWLDRYELEPYFYYKSIKCDLKIKEVPVTKSYPIDGVGYTKMVPVLDWWRIIKPLVYIRLGIKE